MQAAGQAEQSRAEHGHVKPCCSQQWFQAPPRVSACRSSPSLRLDILCPCRFCMGPIDGAGPVRDEENISSSALDEALGQTPLVWIISVQTII